MARRYRGLSWEVVDEIWVWLRAGHAAKPSRRERSALSTRGVRAYLQRCGGIRPDPECRGEGRLSFAEREDLAWFGCRPLTANESSRDIWRCRARRVRSSQ